MKALPLILLVASAALTGACKDETSTEKAPPETTAKPAESPPPAGNPKLLELVGEVDACGPDDECPVYDTFQDFVHNEELSRDDVLAALRAAKSDDIKATMLRRLKQHMSADLIGTVAPYITDDSYSIRGAAQELLAWEENEQALGILVELLDNRDKTDTVRGKVPSLLARYPAHPKVKAALPKLKEMAEEDAQGWGRVDAARAVSAIEKKAAIPFLIERGRTDRWDTARAEIVRELAKYKDDPKAGKALESFAKDEDEKVAKAAREALK